MRVMRATVVLCIVLVGASVDAQSIGERETANTLRAPAGSPGPPATLEAMTWLVGHWKSTGLGGVSEEMWSEPALQIFLAIRDKEGKVREEEFRLERVR